MKLIASAPQGSLLVAVCLLVVLAACQTVPPSPPPAAPVEPAPVAAPAARSARDAAVAEVARLTAIADQDPLLKTGAYGGVPPWDKLNAAAFGKAFETGLALLLAEVDVIAENPEPPSARL